MKSYIVKKGDTLYGISNQFGVSVNDIVRLNNISNPSNISVGSVIKVPEESGSNENTINYIVKRGDTLYSIAKNYNSNVDAIKKINNMKSEMLYIGEELLVPIFSSEQVTLPMYKNYTVKKGDTLYSIARDNNISVDTIIVDNSLNNDVLTIGKVLKIRVIGSEIEECYGSSNNNVEYIVKYGDTLYSIAKKYNTTIDSIKKKNNLKSDFLSLNQKLII